MTVLLYAVGVFFAIALIMDFVARATPAAVAQMPKVRAARQRYVEVQTRGKKIFDEIAQMKSRRDGLLDDNMLLEARLRDAKRRAAAFAAGRTVLVHELGRSAPDRRLYEAYVHHPLVLAPNPPMAIERLNPIYAKPQLIEAWAESLVEARQLIDKTYPKEDGFEIELIGQVADAVVQKAAGPG